MKKIFLCLALSLAIPASADTVKRFVLTDTVPVMDGGDEYTAFELNLTNSNHTGSGNVFYGFKIPDMTLDGQAVGVGLKFGQGFHYGIQLETNLPIIFGPIPTGPMLYYDGIPTNGLSVSDKLTVYGDVSLTDKALRDFDKLAIKNEDLNFGTCDQDQVRIDTGGSVKELCYCDGTNWLCTALREGPQD